MKRIQACFTALAAAQRKALIPYVTAGDPFADITPRLMHTLVAAGADIIELGVPFSDPMADGPVIQRASERALERGIGMRQVLECVQEFRLTDAVTPVVLMGYANPIERMGTGQFVSAAEAAGVDGVLVVDYPPEECEDFAAALQSHGMDMIFLLAPTSTEARMQSIGRIASGYVYYVSLKGITGAGNLDTQSVAAAIPRIRAHVGVPVGVGFGIRDAKSARAVAEVSDGVVIGSRLIELMEHAVTPDEALAAAQVFVAGIRLSLETAVGTPGAPHAAAA